MKITEKIDKHTHVDLSKLVLYPPFPDAVKIEITSRCNYNCNFCASKRKLRKTGDIDQKFLYNLYPRLVDVGVKEAGLFLLGESFLVNNLDLYVSKAKECSIEYVFLTTNGSLYTLSRLGPVIEAGLDSIKFSINAGTAERYKIMHGVNYFDQVFENLRMMRDYLNATNNITLKTCVSSIFIKEYGEELLALKEKALQYVDEFYFLPLYNQAGHVGGLEYTRIIGNPGRYESMVPPVPCWAIFNAFKVSWDGWYTACCFDHDKSFYVADLKETDLITAWHHPKVVKMRQEHLNNTFTKESLCAKCLAVYEQTVGKVSDGVCAKCPEYQKE